MAFPPPPPPVSHLAIHRVLSPSASLRVSPLCLGAMNFGTAWSPLMGTCSKPTAFAMLDAFYAAGGNFIDTAGAYQDTESEQWLGEWMAERGVRDQMVVATKYSTNWATSVAGGAGGKIASNFGGNSAKSLHVSVEASLARLRTRYLDVLYVHWWDRVTGVEELMLALNAVVAQGKVLYLGASDCPAWFVTKCNQYARDHGLRGFVVYQGQWSAAERDVEREILDMCAHEGMGLAPWGALGMGQFKSAAQREKMEREGEKGRMDVWPSKRAGAVSAVLEKVAARKGTGITGVALRYVMSKAPYVFPIVGGRTVEQLQGNIDALGVELDEEDLKEIEAAAEFEVGFPANMLGRKPEEVMMMNGRGNFDYVEGPKAIRPRKL
jgi:aryl-alcohol dehydrogenase-like predicted oxidoreductase